eukprot:TRINITY_DN4962_c0_g1_i19.p1 TRINITY_DN4962_c0_g1~~TRINITY_DN4962_c0_g1_i19.p1  ORF type:complete len:521 (-),score=46.20 TRINITY_DN4962_c0_g1_i19:135-1697(-)
MFLLVVCVRVLMGVLSESWYVPDETWQSVEVAHRLVFGTGYKTWEWSVGIRSSLHPLMFALPLAFLQTLGLHSQYLVVLLPKLTQAIITATCEYLFIQSSDAKLRRWLAVLLIFNWHTLYSGSRTLINTVEYCLTCLTLAVYQNNQKDVDMKKSLQYLPLVGLGFILRPTSALLWAPFCAIDVFNLLRKRRFKTILKWLSLSLAVVVLCVIIDSVFYGSVTITPLNFFIVNVYNNLGVNYGTHPWHWYLSAGLPALLGPLIFPLVVSLTARAPARSNLASREPDRFILPVVFNLVCLSCLPHKEMRFLQSSLPFLFLLIAPTLSKYFTSLQRMLEVIFVVGNVCGALFLSLVHQRGVVDAALFIGSSGAELTIKGEGVELLQLMPCHSTPLYSHIHTNISTRFLECTPNLQNDESYREEADIFYADPESWLQNNFSQDSEKPDLIMYFDVLTPTIKRYLEDYTVCATFFHTMFPEGKVGGHVVIRAKKSLATLACDNRFIDGSPRIFRDIVNIFKAVLKI